MFYFHGRFTHSLDEKSRLMLPKKYHDALKGELYLVLGMEEGCVYLYTSEAYQSEAERFVKFDDLIIEERRLKRTFFSNVTDCALDKLGRLLLPKDLLTRTGIVKEVVIIGSGNRLEIWDKQRYEQTFAKDSEDYESLADTVGRRSHEWSR